MVYFQAYQEFHSMPLQKWETTEYWWNKAEVIY